MSFNSIPSRRSNVLSMHGAVATSDPVATETGLGILKRGGNAADAAVGIAAILNLVDPGSTGLGGDAFVMFYDAKSKTVKGINGSGRSASGLSMALLEERGISLPKGHDQIPFSSGLSVNVPGAAACWLDTVERFGSGQVTLEEILKPAIDIGENGFPVHEFSAYLQQKNKHVLQRSAQSFGGDLLIDGQPPEHGEVMKNEKLANVFKELVKNGKEGFYNSWVSDAIVETVQSAGGCLSRDDLKTHCSSFDNAISTVYKGVRIHEMPPNGQGLVALMALNILEGFQIDQVHERMSAACLHKMIECVQLAFADGFKYIADPETNRVPVDHLLSKEYAKTRQQLIKENRVASEQYYQPTVKSGDDTVYFSVVDCHGNACSFINSIYAYYGSGLVPKDCGFALQCRGSNFSLDSAHPNSVGPRKRSYHTIIPGMATHSATNELYACFGVMGGFMQPQGHLQVLSNLLDYKMDPQTSLCYPRFNIVYSQDRPPVVCLEDTFPQDVINGLKKLGHQVKVVSGMDRIMFGRGQIILVKSDRLGNRVLWSGSESRTDGCAIGY